MASLNLVELAKARRANRPAPSIKWDVWLAAVLTYNNKHSDLSVNDLVFLHKRHDEGLKPEEVFI